MVVQLSLEWREIAQFVARFAKSGQFGACSYRLAVVDGHFVEFATVFEALLGLGARSNGRMDFVVIVRVAAVFWLLIVDEAFPLKEVFLAPFLPA